MGPTLPSKRQKAYKFAGACAENWRETLAEDAGHYVRPSTYLIQQFRDPCSHVLPRDWLGGGDDIRPHAELVALPPEVEHAADGRVGTARAGDGVGVQGDEVAQHAVVDAAAHA